MEPLEGDPYRHIVPGGAPAAKTTAGKESICIDLKTAEGRAVARRLAERADVVVHNFRPGVAERLGLGEADLRTINPDLVWVSVSGYGRHSPGASRPSTHPCAGAATGGALLQAARAADAPCESFDDLVEVSRQLVRANDSNPDPNTSAVAASAILVALVHRQRTGAGQAVHVNMLMANLYANIDDAIEYDDKPPRPAPDRDLTGLSATYRLYRSADGWVFLGVTTDGEWRRLCDAVGDDDLASDPRFRDVRGRATHDAELGHALSHLLHGRSADEWQALGLSACVGLVRADGAAPGVFFSTHPQVHENDFAPECTHARYGLHPVGPDRHRERGAAELRPRRSRR